MTQSDSNDAVFLPIPDSWDGMSDEEKEATVSRLLKNLGQVLRRDGRGARDEKLANARNSSHEA